MDRFRNKNIKHIRLDDLINIDLLYNEYNKKFINKLYVLNDVSYYEEWIKEQNTFIKSLSPEEIYTLRCHTHDGDVIIKLKNIYTFWILIINLYHE